MFLDTQNQFREQMERVVRGESVQLEPGYAEAYATWSEENKNILYQWSAEDRTQHFSIYLQNKVEQDLLKLVNTEELKGLAKRGQLLLVSTDGGKTFDKFLTPKEAKTAVPTEYQVLSPTFRSTTTDLNEVLAEQLLLHVVATLQENFKSPNGSEKELWKVENASLKKGVVHVEVVRNFYQSEIVQDENGMRFAMEVDMDQPATIPLAYERINAKGGKKNIPETQLPEEYGEAQLDSTLQFPTQKNDAGLGLAMGTGFAVLAAQGAAGHISVDQRAKEAAAFAGMSMAQPLAGLAGSVAGGVNVVAAKAAMAAHFARQSQALQDAQTRESKRIEDSKKRRKVVQEQTENVEETKKAGFTASQKTLAKGVGAVAGIAGGFVAALTGSTLFVTLFS